MAEEKKEFDFFYNKTKIVRELRHGFISGPEPKKFFANSRAKNKEVYTFFEIKSFGEENGTYTAVDSGLTNIDMDVADAIYTICHTSHKPNFSTRQVLCVLSGNSKQDLTGTLATEINESISRLCRTLISVSCKDEMKQIRGKNFGGFAELPFLDCTVKNGDLDSDENIKYETTSLDPALDVTKTYLVKHYLPLYYYADLNDNIHSFKSGMLDCYIERKNSEQNGKPRHISNNINNIQLKLHLSRRIMWQQYLDQKEFSIIYGERKTHRAQSRTTNLMKEVGFLNDRPEKFHERVCNILDSCDNYLSKNHSLNLSYEVLYDDEQSIRGVKVTIRDVKVTIE